MNAKATLAKNLIRLRERAGLSQNALAKRCQGIAQSTISRIEAMEVAADVETVNTIASALGVSLWQLLSEGKTSLYPLSVKEETLIYQVRSMVDKDGTNG